MRKLTIYIILISILNGGCLLTKSNKKHQLDFLNNSIICNDKFESFIQYDSLTLNQYIDTLTKDLFDDIVRVYPTVYSGFKPKEYYIASIKNCKDTMQAKELLFSHFKDKYRISTRDTIKHFVEYTFKTDSLTGYTICKSKNWDMGTQHYWCDEKSEYITQNIIRCKKIESLFSFTSGILRSYHPKDIVKIKVGIDTSNFSKVNFDLYEKAKYLHTDIPSLQNYLLDTFNLELKLTNEYTEKHRLISYY